MSGVDPARAVTVPAIDANASVAHIRFPDGTLDCFGESFAANSSRTPFASDSRVVAFDLPRGTGVEVLAHSWVRTLWPSVWKGAGRARVCLLADPTRVYNEVSFEVNELIPGATFEVPKGAFLVDTLDVSLAGNDSLVAPPVHCGDRSRIGIIAVAPALATQLHDIRFFGVTLVDRQTNTGRPLELVEGHEGIGLVCDPPATPITVEILGSPNKWQLSSDRLSPLAITAPSSPPRPSVHPRRTRRR